MPRPRVAKTGRVTLRRRAGTMASWLLVAAGLWFQLGCGYALVGQASTIPEHVEAIYIEPLTNQTRRSEVEQILTRAISEEIVTRRQFDVVASAEEADAVLSGSVLLFSVTPLTFDDEGRATEYEITVNAKMEFRERLQDVVLWKNDRYVYKETYEAEREDETFFDQEKIAIEEASGRFARTMVIDLMEGF